MLLLTEVGWQVFGVVWIILNSSKSDLLVQGFIIGTSLPYTNHNLIITLLLEAEKSTTFEVKYYYNEFMS